MKFAEWVGRRRQMRAERDGLKPAHGCPEDQALRRHIEGAPPEMAVCKALGIYWTGVSARFRGPDAGPIEVRSTIYKTGRLILHENDWDHKPYVLVIARPPIFEIPDLCWIYGRDGKNKQWWEDPTGKDRDAYFVPRDVLRPIGELIELLARTKSLAA